jgi:hypothetical protein
MVYVTAQPESMAAAAIRLHAVGSALAAEGAATATPMTGVMPAAADEVSIVTAAKFATHAQTFQALSAQAAAMHEAFVATLQTSAGSYAATEAANAAATR